MIGGEQFRPRVPGDLYVLFRDGRPLIVGTSSAAWDVRALRRHMEAYPANAGTPADALFSAEDDATMSELCARIAAFVGRCDPDRVLR